VNHPHRRQLRSPGPCAPAPSRWRSSAGSATSARSRAHGGEVEGQPPGGRRPR